jgi:hypothetical protein
VLQKIFGNIFTCYLTKPIYRYEPVVGTMVIFDLTFTHATAMVEDRMRQALRTGRFGDSLTVGSEGFEIVEHQGGF